VRELRRRYRVNKMIDARTEDKSRMMVIFCISFFIITNIIGLLIAGR